MAANTLITLTTDFGLEDIYAAVMKGVILSINPACAIVDITHGVPPQDIQSGALALEDAYRFFPAGAIHVAVVDPDVGSDRRSIVVETDRCFFVGPDNGIFSFAINGHGFRAAYELTENKYFLAERSATFLGRDVFAPAAAHLAQGVPPDKMGRLISEPVLLPGAVPVLRGDMLEGTILHIDRFGNLITNIRSGMLKGFVQDKRIHAVSGTTAILQILPCYAAAQEHELFCILGSSSRLEVSLKNGNAAVRLGAVSGDTIFLKALSRCRL